MIVLGIDPGAKGAFAWVCRLPDREPALVEVEDMPSVEVRGKARVSAVGVAGLLRRRPVDLVVIEQVGAMPKQGVSSTFAFGYGAGVLEGAVAALGLALLMTPPAAWKRKAGVPADKSACRQMCARLWPGWADGFKLVKHDGRADAALLARWGASQ